MNSAKHSATLPSKPLQPPPVPPLPSICRWCESVAWELAVSENFPRQKPQHNDPPQLMAVAHASNAWSNRFFVQTMPLLLQAASILIQACRHLCFRIYLWSNDAFVWIQYAWWPLNIVLQQIGKVFDFDCFPSWERDWIYIPYKASELSNSIMFKWCRALHIW